MTDLILKAEAPAYQGYSIARWNGKVVLIRGAIPGETVEARIEEEKKGYFIASASGITDPSPHRVTPRCISFGACGGCGLQYISHPGQIRIKETVLQDCLKRIAKTETDLAEPLVHDNPWNYRSRGQFKVSPGAAGFYREKTRDVIDIDNCLLMAHGVNERLASAKRLLDDRVYEGELDISCGDNAIALFRDTSRSGPALSSSGAAVLASGFLDSGFQGAFIVTPDKKLFKYGDNYITLGLEGLGYTVSPMSFFQGHWTMNLKVVKLLRDSLLPLKGKRVVDLYAGAGNFSLPLAAYADEIIAVEENPHAIEDGKRNLKLNKTDNCRFIRSSAEAVKITGTADVLLLDPPRPGLTNRAMEKALALGPERIVYISCNPATLSRDLKKLFVKYDLESIRMLDFFPQTYHIESLAFLRLR